MPDGPEIEDRVDLDEDNYSEELDDVAEELEEDEGVSILSNVNVEYETESLERGSSDIDQFPNDDGNQIATEPIEDIERLNDTIEEESKNEHAQLLSLPPHGSEIFIGGLPRDASEGDLSDLCEPIGEVSEIRLIKNKDTGESKGYAFITFKTREVAQKATEELQKKEFKGKIIRCSLSETKHRLFIGNIPKSWTEEHFRKVIDEVGPGIENVELIKDPLNPGRNRGFAFVEYYNNACADYSRQKMSSVNFKFDENAITVTWADPKITPDHTAAAQVKALYVKNIPENTPTEELKELFERHGEITKVVLPPSKTGQGKRDFGFIHFAERSSAVKAVNDTEKYEIHGQVLEVTLAKPQNDKKFEGHGPHNSGIRLNYPTHSSYNNFSANPYGSLGSGYGINPGFSQQPVIYGRGPMPQGMQMVPMVLPDGRIGYVLQRPGLQMSPPQHRRHDRNYRSGGNDDGNRGRRYRPY